MYDSTNMKNHKEGVGGERNPDSNIEGTVSKKSVQCFMKQQQQQQNLSLNASWKKLKIL